MKKLFVILAACLIMAGCSNESDETRVSNEPTEVTLSFSPYQQEAMTRSAVSVSKLVTHLDVWIYESGSEVTAMHQTTATDGFGTVSVVLDKTKTYTLYAVAHKADGATLADGVISFTDDKVTHAMFYTETFSPATKTNLSCLMNRIVAQFQFSTTDQCPDDVTKMRFTIGSVFDRWNVSTGATHQLDRVSTFENFQKKNDGTVTFNLYAIATDAQTTHIVTIEALNSSDEVKQTRTFTDVPLRNGYKTIYQGVYFTDTPASANFTVGDWNVYDTVEF